MKRVASAYIQDIGLVRYPGPRDRRRDRNDCLVVRVLDRKNRFSTDAISTLL
jgi:hypothetical protein